MQVFMVDFFFANFILFIANLQNVYYGHIPFMDGMGTCIAFVYLYMFSVYINV